MAVKNSFKNFIRKIHLILGLTTGIVVFIVAITGCLWVFQDEITKLITEPYNFDIEEKAFITPTQAEKIAGEVYPGRNIHGVLYGDKSEAVEVIFWEEDPEFYRAVFLNPFNGDILDKVDYEAGFFHFILEGHMNLWLPEEIGNQVVSWSTFIFVAMLITGIILWWPKNKSGRKKRLKFMWKPNTGWKRKNYDLHSIVGFYISLIALIASLTGLMMAFEWFQNSIYKTIGGDKSIVFSIPENRSNPIDLQQGDSVKAIDRLLPQLREEYPEAELFEIHYPYSDSSSIYVETTYERGVYYSSDYRFYDQYTLEELDTPSVYGKYENADGADMVVRTTYDIHVGAILGLPGKIIAFVSSLLVASLPVTGFMMWWGKRGKPVNKSRQKKSKKQGKIKRHSSSKLEEQTEAVGV